MSDLVPAPASTDDLTVDDRRFLEAVFHAVAHGLYALDEQGRVIRVNAAAEELLGWEEGHLRGRNIHEAIHHHRPDGSEYPELECPLFKVIGAGDTVHGQEVFIRRDGSRFPVEYHSAPIRDGDRVIGAVLTFRDIGAQEEVAATAREAITLRQERQRLFELEQVKSQFLNLVAHELRGPLTVARGYASMLWEGTFGPVEHADLRPAMPMLISKLAEINSLVDQMLEAARLESSELHLTFELLHLRDPAHEALRAMIPLAGDHHLLAVWGGDDDGVVGDRGRLATIVTNLLDNACKYSPQATEIELRTAREAGQVLLSVTDHGLGVAAGDLPTLFTRFGRVVTADNSHIPGSGLGLYICREVARMHGGDITVQSAPGAGSTFTLRLPAADRAPRVGRRR